MANNAVLNDINLKSNKNPNQILKKTTKLYFDELFRLVNDNHQFNEFINNELIFFFKRKIYQRFHFHPKGWLCVPCCC